MINTMKIQGHTAVISFDPELGRFRGGSGRRRLQAEDEGKRE